MLTLNCSCCVQPHLRYILTDKDSGAGLRSAAIAILSSLVTIGNHYFGSLEVVQAVEDKVRVESAQTPCVS